MLLSYSGGFFHHSIRFRLALWHTNRQIHTHTQTLYNMGHLIFFSSVRFVCDLFASINKESRMFLICNALTCFRLYSNRFSCYFWDECLFYSYPPPPPPVPYFIHSQIQGSQCIWICCVCTSSNSSSVVFVPWPYFSQVENFQKYCLCYAFDNSEIRNYNANNDDDNEMNREKGGEKMHAKKIM